MKNLKKYICESIKVNKQSPFKETTKFTMSDWNSWKSKGNSQDITVYEDPDNGICNVYGKNNQHLAIYKIDDQMLLCDDKSLFGLE